MKFVTLGGETVALCLASPNWAGDSPVTLELALPTEIAKALSDREARRNFARTFRYTLTYKTLFATARESTDFRLGLLRLKGETVAVPMWVDAVELSTDENAGSISLGKTAEMPVRYGSEWIVLSADGSTYEIVTVSAVSADTVTLATGLTLHWPAGTLMYPLLFGKFAERPRIDAIDDEKSETSIKITENSGYDRRLNVTATPLATVGAGVPNFSTARLWDIAPDFVKPVDSTEVDILERLIGFLREEQQQVYQQAVRRGLELAFLPLVDESNGSVTGGLSRAGIAKLEAFVHDRRAQVLPFMIPTFRGDLRLADDVAAGASVFQVEATTFDDPGFSDHPGTPYLALIDAITGAIECVKITSFEIDGYHTIAPFTASHPAATTIVCHLLLVRLVQPKLTWRYLTDRLAATTEHFLERPDEYATQLTPLAEPVYLFEFLEEFPNGSRLQWLYTSYENTIVIQPGDQTWVPGPFSFGDTTENLRLEAAIELRTFEFDGHPLKKLLPFGLDSELLCNIYEVDFANLAAPGKLIFPGVVEDLIPKGKEWTAKLSWGGHRSRRKVPRYFIQKGCNYTLYTPRPECGVARADWQTTGTIAARLDKQIDVSGVPGTGDPGARPNNYWAGGDVETGVGTAFERRGILASAQIAGGQRLFLDRPLLKAADGNAISFWPTCSGSVEACKSFNNWPEGYGGFPHVPDQGPQVRAVQPKQSTGGKK